MSNKREDHKETWKSQRDKDQIESPYDELPLEEIKKEGKEERDKKTSKKDSETDDAFRP